MTRSVIQDQTTHKNECNGFLLENLTWVEAEKLLTSTAVIVIPLGAGAKEHGPHLKLKNDWLIAEYLKKRILQQANVIIAPTVNYSFYPAFLEYPGSISLPLETARDMIVSICRTLANYGPRRFYVINTGVSTINALEPAVDLLASEGVILRYTDILHITETVEKAISKQEGGSHADEVETSMMLYIDPESVDMKKAEKDYNSDKSTGRLTRNSNGEGIYSPTGIWGDATLATREKGKKITEALVKGILKDIEEIRKSDAIGN